VHGLEAEWGDQVNFIYLDIDDPATQPFKSALGYQYQPHMFLVDGDGQVVQQWVGLVDRETLEQALEDITG
jgi:thioredoxin-like negative regulator of GroEL